MLQKIMDYIEALTSNLTSIRKPSTSFSKRSVPSKISLSFSSSCLKTKCRLSYFDQSFGRILPSASRFCYNVLPWNGIGIMPYGISSFISLAYINSNSKRAHAPITPQYSTGSSSLYTVLSPPSPLLTSLIIYACPVLTSRIAQNT